MLEWVFALVHLALFLGLLSYSIASLLRGRWLSGLVLLAFMVAYYFIVLHQAVLKEIKRKKKSARSGK
ncbi:MAG: hypothetical protein NUW07_04455 [Candidatus Saccharicenans sp.]|jgi:hypothetical protein|nr:hypothetical protein [Candidatus Saccharicenans sp.]MDH7492247.1 hypothetical protein [Candidatus Saccharicenans sp.]